MPTYMARKKAKRVKRVNAGAALVGIRWRRATKAQRLEEGKRLAIARAAKRKRKTERAGNAAR